MSANEFKHALEILGLNPTSAGRYFGVSRQHIHNIINGTEIPHIMELLINILMAMDETERSEWLKTP